MTNKPVDYVQWCQIFDEISEWEIGYTDINIVNAVKNGELEMVSSVAERFTQRLLSLISSSFDFANLLKLFKKELIFLKQLASIKVLPQKTSDAISEQIISLAKETQKDLLNHVKRDLTGDLRQIVADCKIDDI